FAGVNGETGLYQFYDKGGAITSEPGDGNENKVVRFDPNPKFYGGFLNTFEFKGFQLDLLFQYVKQQGENNRFGYQPGAFNNNQPKGVLSSWHKAGDISDIQRYSTYFTN